MVRKYLYGNNAIRSYLLHAKQQKLDGELWIGRNSKHSDLIDLATSKGLKCKHVSQSRGDNQSKSRRLPLIVLYNCSDDIIHSLPDKNHDHSAFISSLQVQRYSTIVLLDNITDVHNIGAIIRSAVFFAVDAVVSCIKLSSLAEQTLAHTSAGSVFNIPLLFGCNLHRMAQLLKSYDYWIIGLDHKNGGKFSDEVWHRNKIALVLGSEDKGISSLLLSKCDYLYQIIGSPMVDSLNVSVAAGITFTKRFAASRTH